MEALELSRRSTTRRASPRRRPGLALVHEDARRLRRRQRGSSARLSRLREPRRRRGGRADARQTRDALRRRGEMDAHGRSSSAASGCSGGSATLTESRSGSTASPSRARRAPLAKARAQADESLDILRAVGDRRTFGKVLWASRSQRRAGRCRNGGGAVRGVADALRRVRRSLVLRGRARVGGVAGRRGRRRRASGPAPRRRRRGLGGHRGAAARRVSRAPRPRARRGAHELGEARFAAAWDEGRRLPLGATIELVAPARRAAGPTPPRA